jgi:hypothetical protein
VGGQKRSTVLIAAIVAEGIVNNIRDCKTHYVNEKGAGRRKSGPPLNILAAAFYLLGESNGVALLDRSSCRIEFDPQWRRRAVGRELGSEKGRKNFSFLELRTILAAW